MLYIHSTPGSPYRPRNGTEGYSFMASFCDRCLHDAKYRRTEDGEDGCEILARTFIHDIGDPEYPKEWTHDKDGVPTCTAFVEGDDEEDVKRRASAAKTLPLFDRRTP